MPATEYPRRLCLGLIEARRSAVWDRSSSAYPRRLCLGLIEAYGLLPFCLRSIGHIRGVYASASLKHIFKPAAQSSFAIYPRRLCLGLIEATVTNS